MATAGARRDARGAQGGQEPEGLVMAVLYTRISGSGDQKEGLSLESQLASTRGYAAGHGWVIDGEYQDVMTGLRDDRAGYQELLAHVRALRSQGRQVRIVVKWLHRFGRNMLERVRSFKELHALGVQVHSVTDGGHMPEFVANVLASVSQEESRQTGERVSEMAQFIMERGWVTGRTPNWGYRWRDATTEEKGLGAPRRVLEVNPDEAPSVRELWRLAAGGRTVRQLTGWAATLPLLARGGRRLGTTAMRKVLASPIYVGLSMDAVGLPPAEALRLPRGKWPTLADEADWLRVRERQERSRGRRRQASNRFLLTGVLTCPRCGYRLAGNTNTRPAVTPDHAPYRISRYRCLVRDAGPRPDGVLTTCHFTCQSTHLDGDVLASLTGALDRLLGMDARTEEKLHREWRRLQVQSGAGRAGAQRGRRALEAQLQTQQRLLARASIALLTHELDRVAYDATKAVLMGEIVRLERELAAPEAAPDDSRELPPLEALLSRLGGWAHKLADSSVAAQREVLLELVDNVQPVHVRGYRWRGEIRWSPVGLLLTDAHALLEAFLAD